MSSLARPRGPLPARTYWVRRALVVATVVALVVGLNNLIGGGGGGDGSGAGGPDQAVQAAVTSQQQERETTGVPPAVRNQPTATKGKGKKDQQTKPKPPPLPEPEGVCLAEDIEVRPVVKKPVAGRPVVLALRLTTITTPACYWRVSPSTITLTITSGKDHIWSSRECRRSIPASDVVLRQTEPVWVRVNWSARRSDEECSKRTLWALPGWYHLQAAALAGEPEDVQFQLVRPTAELLAQEAEAKQEQKKKQKKKQNEKDKKKDREGEGNG